LLRLGLVNALVVGRDRGVQVGFFGVFGLNLLLRDSHLNGTSVSASLYSSRIICTNGLNVVVNSQRTQITHALGLEANRERVKQLLQDVVDTIAEQEETHIKLAQQTMDKVEATAQLIAAFGTPGASVEEQPRVVRQCIRLFDGEAQGSDFLTAYNTAYGLLQAVSEYYNWHAPSRSPQTALNSLLSGQRGQKVNNFQRQLVSVCL